GDDSDVNVGENTGNEDGPIEDILPPEEGVESDIYNGDDISLPEGDTEDYIDNENEIDINDIFEDTYWVTRTGNIDEEMAMSIHSNLMYGYHIASGNLSGGDIQDISIVDNNTVFVSTLLSDGNGSVEIEYRIMQSEPGVITITERWLKTPAYEFTATYYQISEEEYSNL
ncbi:MAG: hypothetical protein IJH55_01360, partial [Romboutsia sp.]|nr:hypothetical protein [Romboutsia sp.]